MSMTTVGHFTIDRRIGCIAVRRTSEIDPQENGLDPCSSGVVFYEPIPRVLKPCSTCGHPREDWENGDKQFASAVVFAMTMEFGKCPEMSE